MGTVCVCVEEGLVYYKTPKEMIGNISVLSAGMFACIQTLIQICGITANIDWTVQCRGLQEEHFNFCFVFSTGVHENSHSALWDKGGGGSNIKHTIHEYIKLPYTELEH